MNELDVEFAGRLRGALRHVVQFIRQIDAVSPLSSQQVSMLGYLRGGGRRASDVAQFLGVRAPTATQGLNRLVEAGFVERRADASDARASIVALTPLGVETLDHEERNRNERVATALALLSAEDRALLEGALPVLERLMHDDPATPEASAAAPASGSASHLDARPSDLEGAGR